MTDSFLHNSEVPTASPASTGSIASEPAAILLRRAAYAMAGLTLFLMALGSATRVMNAGLACPDWPLCYGELVPSQQMNLQVFLEWFHRLVASTMGLLAIGLTAASWWLRQSLPKWTPWLTLAALCLVVFQGILGGLTVTELLRFDIVTAHLGTGLLFFSVLLAIALGLTPAPTTGSVGRLPWFGLVATALVYGQSLLGGLVASQWALHLCLGEDELCSVMNAHLIGIVPATLASATLVIGAWLSPSLPTVLWRLAQMAGLLLALQLFLGTATFRLHLQVEPLTVAHQAVGAALLGTLLSFTLLAFRRQQVVGNQVPCSEP